MSRPLALFVLLVASWNEVGANIIIESPNVTNWGNWATQWDMCTPGTFVQAIQIKTEAFQGPIDDDTAANGFRMYCGDPSNINTRIIMSAVGDFGSWGNVYSCRSDDRPVPPDGYMTGFQLRVEAPRPIGVDDTATNNIRIFCNYPDGGTGEQMKEGDGLGFGTWSAERKCNSNQRVCAIQTQVQPYQGSSVDDTALNNIRLECCDV